jgi:hypothetical protein
VHASSAIVPASNPGAAVQNGQHPSEASSGKQNDKDKDKELLALLVQQAHLKESLQKELPGLMDAINAKLDQYGPVVRWAHVCRS